MNYAQLERTIDATLIGLASVLGALMLWVIVRAVMRGRTAGIRCQHCGYERGAAIRCSECGLTVAEARRKALWGATRWAAALAIGAVVFGAPVAIKKVNHRQGVYGLVPSWVWLAISSPRESGLASSVAASRIWESDAWEWQVDRWLRLDVPADPEALRKGVRLSLREGERSGGVWAELTGELSLLSSPAVSQFAPVRIRARRAGVTRPVDAGVSGDYSRDAAIVWPGSEGFERVPGNHEAGSEWIIERAFDFGNRRVLIDEVTIKGPALEPRFDCAEQSGEIERLLREHLVVRCHPAYSEGPRFEIYGAQYWDEFPAMGIEVIVKFDGVVVARARAVHRGVVFANQGWGFTVIDEQVSPEWRETILAMTVPEEELGDPFSFEVVGVPALGWAARRCNGAIWEGRVELPPGRLQVDRSRESWHSGYPR